MRRFLKYWLPLLIWFGAMFIGSTNLMSSEHTSRYIIPSLVWLNPETSQKTMWTIIIVVRKNAHIIEYAILAFLLWRFLRSFPPLRGKTKMCFAAVLLGCAMFAASDEFHQTFVRSRTPSVRDVCLDIAGVLIGLLIAASFIRRDPRKSRRTTRPQLIDAQL
jgi:VanZ family protein